VWSSAGECPNRIRGTTNASGGAEAFAHLRGLMTIAPVRKDAPHGRSEGVDRDGRPRQDQTGTELFRTPTDDFGA